MKSLAQCGDDEGVANVRVWPCNHALDALRNHLAYLNRFPSHDSIYGMAARHNILRLIRAALEIAYQPLGQSFCHWHHVGDLQA
ncbi:hypothetical protein A2U01_0073647 [Trifolium medium]|uniref:Uncharacterized protein n=1 Tax=Trifolium medium TaxID=97028 RepID=A0A392SU95_9FABA|nr:hypothetical protein [Trifolium medium]